MFFCFPTCLIPGRKADLIDPVLCQLPPGLLPGSAVLPGDCIQGFLLPIFILPDSLLPGRMQDIFLLHLTHQSHRPAADKIIRGSADLDLRICPVNIDPLCQAAFISRPVPYSHFHHCSLPCGRGFLNGKGGLFFLRRANLLSVHQAAHRFNSAGLIPALHRQLHIPQIPGVKPVGKAHADLRRPGIDPDLHCLRAALYRFLVFFHPDRKLVASFRPVSQNRLLPLLLKASFRQDFIACSRPVSGDPAPAHMSQGYFRLMAVIPVFAIRRSYLKLKLFNRLLFRFFCSFPFFRRSSFFCLRRILPVFCIAHCPLLEIDQCQHQAQQDYGSAFSAHTFPPSTLIPYSLISF